MKRFHIVCSVVTAGLLLAAPAYADDTTTPAMNPSGGEKVKLSRGDKKFLEQVMEDNSRELANAQLALQKAQSDDVKSFAQKMVDDHTKAGEKLRTLCSQLGADTRKDDADKLMKPEKKLEKAAAKDFDRKFMELMVKDHQRDVKLFEKQSKKADNDQVREFAATTLATLQEHHHMAMQVRDAVKSGKGESVTTGARNPGAKGGMKDGSAAGDAEPSTGTQIMDPGMDNKGAQQ